MALDLRSLSARVRYARRIRGVSGRAASLAAGLSDSVVGQIEREEISNPSSKTLERIAVALRCSAAWLSFGQGEAPVVDDVGPKEGAA